MPTIQEIDAEIAKRERLAAIDAEIARREGSAADAFLEPAIAVGGNLLNLIGSGFAGIGEAVRTGDLAKAGQLVQQIQQQATKDLAPETEAGKAGLSNLMAVLEPIDQLIKTGVSGTAGLANVALNPISNMRQGFQPAIQTTQAVRERGLGSAAGQQVFKETGSPALAAITETFPVLGEEAAGGLIGRIIGRAQKAKSKVKTQEAQRALDGLISGDSAKNTTVIDVSEAIKKGDVDDIAAIIDADPEFFRAADELGVSTEPLASFASRNPQFRDVEQALATVPGNVLDPQAKAFIGEVSQKADNIIEQYGGTLDKAQLGLDFKSDSLKVVDNLFQQADDTYSSLRTLIPEQSRFAVPSAVAFLEDLASKDKLPPKFARILKQLKPKTTKTRGVRGVNPATGQRFDTGVEEVINPTLGRIDLTRKEIGQAIGKGSGSFKDVETGLNKALYAKLTKDQDAIAASVGGEALSVSDTGKALVKQRKQIEDNLVTLYGKNLNQALNVNVSGAIKGLQKGEVDKFADIMNAIPKEKRGEVALSAMNDVFKGSGVNQSQLGPTQFVKWYQTINRSPAAKRALFNALPKDSRKAIDNLFEVSRGISRALGQKTPTGRINAMFNNETGFVRKMIRGVAAPLVGISTGSPVVSALASNATEQFLKQSTDGARMASDLMASPQFQSVIRQSVKEGVIDGNKASKQLMSAERKLSKTKLYQQWSETLGKEDRALLTGGLTGYLFGQNQEQQ